MSEKHFIRNILIYLSIALAVAVGAYVLSNFVIWGIDTKYYILLMTVVFCTCLILHKLGELKNRK